MTPPWVLRVFRTARYHELINCIDKYFFNEKDDLLVLPSIHFYDGQISWKKIFSVSSLSGTETVFSVRNLSDYNIITIIMKKDAAQT